MDHRGEPDGPTSFRNGGERSIFVAMETRPPDEPQVEPSPPERRRSKERLFYSKDQLLGRSPIYLRRRRDKQRLVGHALVAVFLVGLRLWWVIPLHTFAGPVLFTFTQTHGVHQGDLPTLLFLAVAARSMWKAVRLGLDRRPATVRAR